MSQKKRKSPAQAEDDETAAFKKRRVLSRVTEEQSDEQSGTEGDVKSGSDLEHPENECDQKSEKCQFPARRMTPASVFPVRRGSGATPHVMAIADALALDEKPKHACIRFGLMAQDPIFPIGRFLCGFCSKPLQKEDFWSYAGPNEEQQIKCTGTWSKSEGKYVDHHVNTPTTMQRKPLRRVFILEGLKQLFNFVLG